MLWRVLLSSLFGATVKPRLVKLCVVVIRHVVWFMLFTIATKHYNSILLIRHFCFVTATIFDVKYNEKYNLLKFFSLAVRSSSSGLCSNYYFVS